MLEHEVSLIAPIYSPSVVHHGSCLTYNRLSSGQHISERTSCLSGLAVTDCIESFKVTCPLLVKNTVVRSQQMLRGNQRIVHTRVAYESRERKER